MAELDYVKCKYDDTFEAIYKNLKYQKENDDNFEIHHLEKLLESLYINDGNDWLGRGDIQDAINSATICACEVLLDEWRGEVSK